MGIRPPLRDAQDESPACYCGKCGGEVYLGEKLFEWDGKMVCVDCFKGEMCSWLDRSPEQVADALNFEYEEVSG